ncbi:helix-turn-helix domain-containing protein [Neolewinella sp.]|uniref:helix-turn-helix domain-containing protein n=1 Tax=Neolewinella sp. TaxID=2993543 RepID=UPI003B5291EE
MLLRLLLPLLLATTYLPAQTLIEGHAPAAYRNQLVQLDILDDHIDVVTIADYMILAQTEVDFTGYFRFGALTLPKGPSYYRIRYRNWADPPVSMDFEKRHYLHAVIKAGDTLRVDGLEPTGGSATNTALARFEAQFDTYADADDPTLPTRAREELTQLRDDYIRRTIQDTRADPYVRVFALGKLGEDAPNQQALQSGSEALAFTNLPLSYEEQLMHDLGGFTYRDLQRQNTWLKLALGILFIITGYCCWSLYTRRPAAMASQDSPTPVASNELTDKEREVLEQIAAGHSNKEVAARLFVSVSTVKSHINSIYRKLGVTDRRAVVEAWEEQNSTPV